MALFDRKSTLAAALAGAATVGLAASPLQADEQNNTPAQMTQTSSASADNQLASLRIATQESRAFAQSGFNIAITLHNAGDIPNAKFQTPQQVGGVFQQHYQSLLDAAYPEENGRVGVFYAPNPDGRASLITVRIGDQVFQIDNEQYGRSGTFDPAILDLTTAWNAAPEIVEVLPTAKAIQERNERRRASLDTGTPALSYNGQ